jgi:acyl-CoA reductase-like NAD-dependent aldehyde dehydrogenase
MSRDRARRREVRLAEAAAREAGAGRRRDRDRAAAARRARFAALAARLPGRRRARPFGSRRPRRQLTVVVGAVLAVQLVTWYLSDSWPLRIAVAALTVLAVPAHTTLTFDRSSNR